MPWRESGSISTAPETSFSATTSASGTMQISTGVLDETTGQEQTAIERTHLSSGQASKNYSEQGTRTYAVTYVPSHTYRPYIKLEGQRRRRERCSIPVCRLMRSLIGSAAAWVAT